MKRKVEFIESYFKVGNDYQWNDNHGELIRCNDCKYFNAEPVEEHTPYGFSNIHYACWCDKHTDYDNQKYLEVCTDDFCSWAEPKDGKE